MAQVLMSGNPNRMVVNVAYGTAVTKGDLLKLDQKGSAQNPAPLAVRVTAASDNDQLYAIADADHVALITDDGKTHSVVCSVPDPNSVYEFECASSNIQQGQGLAMTDHNTLHLAITDHVAVAIETKTTATKIRCIFLTPPLWGGASKAVSYSAG